MIIQCDLLRRK